VLIIIGLFMVAPQNLKSLAEKEDLLTVFTLIVTMTIPQNIGVGLSISILVYPIFMIATGKKKEIHLGFWALVTCSLLLLAVYPY
jgi:xanthine/uracil/vitamin C permease (AzgA family)